MNEESLEWRIGQLEKQIELNTKEHMAFYEFYHRLDKDMAVIAMKIGAMAGASASVVTWVIPLVLQYLLGVYK